jgi:hypothetical protein
MCTSFTHHLIACVSTLAVTPSDKTIVAATTTISIAFVPAPAGNAFGRQQSCRWLGKYIRGFIILLLFLHQLEMHLAGNRAADGWENTSGALSFYLITMPADSEHDGYSCLITMPADSEHDGYSCNWMMDGKLFLKYPDFMDLQLQVDDEKLFPDPEYSF